MRRQPPKVPRPTPVPRVHGPLDAASFTPAEAESFWAGAGSRQPMVESLVDGTSLVTFCWRSGEASAVLLFANRLTDETDLPATLLSRVPGTDIFHATFRMDDDWRASYSFLVQGPDEEAPWRVGDQVQIRQVLDRGVPDPRNPRVCHNRAGVQQSVVELNAAPPQPWLSTGAPSGTLVPEVGPDGRTVWLYTSPTPPGVDGTRSRPLVVVLDGEVWIRPEQGLLGAIDRMVSAGVLPPVLVALPESGGRETRWHELGSPGAGVRDVVADLIGWVRARHPVSPGPEGVVVAGQSLGGLTALRAALGCPELVGAALSHSASLWSDDLSDLDTAAARASRRPRVFLSHGRQEWVLTGPHESLAARLVDVLGDHLATSVHNGGHDYAWWRGGLCEALQWWAAGL